MSRPRLQAPWILLALFSLMTFASVTVWLRLHIINLTYAIRAEEQKVAKALQQRDQVQVQVSALRSPQHLERIATQQQALLGLGPAKWGQVIHLATDLATESDEN